MTDYGQDIQFGTFITPTNGDPEIVVDLALQSESLGFDLATFQDHPYQPRFFDTWTLLAFLAARTTTIRLAPNVTNLPLRPPAMIARASASLDILSRGRIELALGAGGFWDAIEAMGGRRLSPGHSVDALEEAIMIIRQLWDTTQRTGARFPGDYYSVTGAKRGPAPAHDMEIWVGAYKPRMLGLVGRLADGWLPSLFNLDDEQLGAMHARVDAAATTAGRDPASIRRLVNIGGSFDAGGEGRIAGPPEVWVAELSRLAIDFGFSTFILASDDAGILDRFARDVIPAVGEAVAVERHR